MSAAQRAAATARATGAPVFTRPLSESEVAGFHGGTGVLAGVPFVLKDNLDLVGIPTTGGCPALTKPATRSAGAVQRLLEAGAVPVGKTNLDQFATGLVGTRSPYGACTSVASAEHISGGSSSGSAVAVALGIVPLGLGTDTAGSGRVPAAFNGLVGVKPTKGLVSTAGLLPACRSLDCVTTLTRTVGQARQAMAVLAAYDSEDPWSRPAPVTLPAGVARVAQVIGIPRGPLDLDPQHRQAWEAAVEHAHSVAAQLVEVDLEPFLAAARLLYEGPWLAERWAGFGHLLEPDGPHLDPVVRQIILPGRELLAADAFAGLDRLATLRRASEGTWADLDALLLPVTPGHPTLAEVAADPIRANARLGTYTNFVNLLDLCAVAVPAGQRADGLPFGVQLVAPAFADGPLLELAARWCGEAAEPAAIGAGRTLVAVVGAHLSGLPLNPQLVGLGGRLHTRTRTGGGYRLYALPGAGVPRPGLMRGDGPAGGIALEVWDLPHQGLGQLADLIPSPLGLGTVQLADGTGVLGFLAEPAGLEGALDVSSDGGWRAHLAGR
ncbi:MAG: allophanate hydrolase [Frankiales bacterium]|nr:allophanate hydrolase [Frankiales bacterium]